MIPEDLEYVRRAIAAGQVRAPVLELGVGYEGSTCREAVLDTGIPYFGTDTRAANGVDFVVDFDRPVRLDQFGNTGPFGTVLVLNVLEHTFDPIRVLDNVVGLLSPRGACLAITPAVWPLHNYPKDVWRPLPQFYELYCERRGLLLERSCFDYVGLGPVASFKDEAGANRFPKPGEHTKSYWYSKAVHKLLNTRGKGMFFPSHFAIGAVMRMP